MFDGCDTQKNCIELDLSWVKKELEGLTKRQRCLILDEYAERVKHYGIGITEYKAFVKAFNELED